MDTRLDGAVDRARRTPPRGRPASRRGGADFFVSAPHEERVREAVEVSDGLRIHRCGAREGDSAALGPAADGAADVEIGVEARAAGEHEGAKRGQLLLAFVHLALQQRDVGLGDARLLGMDVLGQRREDGSEVEELVLDAREGLREGDDVGPARREEDAAREELRGGLAGRAHEGVELVDGAVRLDAQIVLGDALTADEARRALIAVAGVHAVDRDLRVAEDGAFARGGRSGVGHGAWR